MSSIEVELHYLTREKYQLTIQYDGSDFHGWQVQPRGRTVQGDIERALMVIYPEEKITLIASGRTDSGVHAIGQVANILIDTEYSSDNIKNILNANLEKKIWITNCQETDLGFHARFSAISRVYEYHITRLFSPFDYKRATNFINNKGLRIDHFLLPPSMVDKLEKCYIDSKLRGLEKPSDHVPIVCEFKL